MDTLRIRSADGVMIAAIAAGPREAPAIVLVHGFAHSCACFERQLAGGLARRFRVVAYDLRGHGVSDAPQCPQAYSEGQLWSADLACVIRAFGLDRPVVVGWSVGGRVVGQYLADHGSAGIAGVGIVASRPTRASQADAAGPATAHGVAMQSADFRVREAAAAAFVRDCYEIPPDAASLARMVAAARAMPMAARVGALSFFRDYTDEFERLAVPLHVAHGLRDRFVLPAASKALAAQVPGASLSLYETCGHAPFFEDAARFDAELAAFADSCRA